MSKRAASLSIVIIGALGCRNVPPMEGKEIHPAPCSTASPNTPAQQPPLKVGPEVVPARKTLAIAVKAPKAPSSRESLPGEVTQTSASVSPKDVIAKPSDNPAKTEAANVEDTSKPRAVALQKDSIEGPTSASQPQKTLRDDLLRDVWFVLATVSGAVFTYILAPVIVEIIKGRLVRHPRQPDAGQLAANSKRSAFLAG